MTDAPTSAAGTGTRPIAVVLMVVSALLACIGQVFWKVGATRGLVWIAVGLVLYALAALVMVVAYRHGELSTLQPILGLSYALSLVAGAFFLSEQVTPGRIVGVVVVTVGVALVASTRSVP